MDISIRMISDRHNINSGSSCWIIGPNHFHHHHRTVCRYQRWLKTGVRCIFALWDGRLVASSPSSTLRLMYFWLLAYVFWHLMIYTTKERSNTDFMLSLKDKSLPIVIKFDLRKTLVYRFFCLNAKSSQFLGLRRISLLCFSFKKSGNLFVYYFERVIVPN